MYFDMNMKLFSGAALLLVLPGVLTQECELAGTCLGHFIHSDTSQSTDDCLRLCQDFNKCQWYTFYQDSGDCILHDGCSQVDDSCVSCVSGEKGCKPTDTMTKLMVISGIGTEGSVEILGIGKPENSTVCVVDDFPMISGSVAGLVGGEVLVCGGQNSFGGTLDCYYLDGTTWKVSKSMSVERRNAAAVQMNPDTFWISGGANDFYHWDSSDWTTAGNPDFEPYVDLPEPKERHNLVKVNNTHAMLLGGTGSTRAWMFDTTTMTWTRLPDMRNSRYSSFAGRIINPDGTVDIAIAGGTNEITTELYSLETNKWRYGPELPVERELYKGTSVQYGNSFLVIGGFINGPGSQDAIYRYNEDLHEWEILDRRMTTTRYMASAVLIADDTINC